MELFKVILNRRSIRKYKPDPISDKDLKKMLEAARLAPSWANTQCWRFIIVLDPRIKNAIADTLPVRNPGADAIRTAPVTIVACAEKNKAGFFDSVASTDKGDWFMFDVGIAMEHIALTAYSLGLGTLHIGLFDTLQAESVLNVPEGYHVVELMPVGYPDESPAARPRKELREILFYNNFGRTSDSG